MGAGTDANVTISIFGVKDQLNDLKLITSNNKNPFENGQLDKFVFRDLKPIGDVGFLLSVFLNN